MGKKYLNARLDNMIIVESPDEHKTSFDQLPISRLLEYGSDANNH